MIWKRGEGVTIDLRRPREEAGGLSTLRRLALQFGMTLAGALVVAVWVLFLLTMIEPRDLPFTIEDGGLTRWITCEVTDPSQGLQDYDQILAVDGRPVGSEYFSPDRTDRLDPAKVRDFSQSLYGRTTATLLVRRVVPNPEGRFACDGSWYNGTSEDTLSIEISTTRSISYGAFVDLLGRAIAVLVLALGFLALRARSSDAATPYFISVCILAGVAFSATLPGLWIKWANPLFAATPIAADYTLDLFELLRRGEDKPPLALVFSFTLIFLAATLRLLHVFPSENPDLARRFPLPRRTVAFLVALMLFFGFVPQVNNPPYGYLYLLTGLPFMATVGLIFYLCFQIFQVARARLKERESLEASEQARLALQGVLLGFLLALTGLWIAPMGGIFVLWLSPFAAQLSTLGTILFNVGVLVTFLGFFLAIVRRGLWDVDLFRKRATTYTTLTVLFFIAWIALELLVETTFSQLSGGLVGTLGAPLLAAGLVAVSQRRVTNGITRRFFPQSVDFDRAIAEVSEQLTSADSRSAAVQLGQRLSEALGADPCVVLVRMKDSLLEELWATESATPIDKIVGAVEGALEEHTSAIVMTDDGPILAARIGTGAAFPGMLLLGPRRGGQFYSTEDRRLLGVLLNQAAMALRQATV